MSRGRTEHGFSLVEALVATAIAAIAFTTATQLLIRAVAADRRARLVTRAAILAAAKMEELQSLAFEVDADGSEIDAEDLAQSPADALVTDASMYSDYFDAAGGRISTAGGRAAGAAFVRRWSIRAVDPSGNTVALQVRVTGASGPPLATFTAIRTRRGG